MQLCTGVEDGVDGADYNGGAIVVTDEYAGAMHVDMFRSFGKQHILRWTPAYSAALGELAHRV